MNQDRPSIWKNHWKQLGWAYRSSKEGVSGNHQGRANTVSQVDGDSDMASACQLFVGRQGVSQKRNNGFCQHFVWQKAALHSLRPLSPALPLIPDNFVFPSMSLMLSKLPQCWNSEGVSQSKSVHGPYKRNCLGHQKPSISFSHNPCWVLWPEVMGISLSDTGTLGWGPGVGLEPLAPLVETPQPIYHSQFSIYHTCMWD